MQIAHKLQGSFKKNSELRKFLENMAESKDDPEEAIDNQTTIHKGSIQAFVKNKETCPEKEG